MFKKYVCIKQNNSNDCAAACISTIAKYYGINVTIAHIRELAGTDKHGTNIFGIVKASKELGFDAKAVKITKDSMLDDFALPAIAHIINDGLLHYVVIHKVNRKYIIIADPAEGIVKYTYDDFLKLWTGVLVMFKPTEHLQKNANKTSALYKFIYIIINQKCLFIKISLLSFVISFIGLINAQFYKILMDQILPSKTIINLNIFAGGILWLFLIRTLLNTIRQNLLLHLSKKIDLSLILKFYQHILNLPVNFFETRKTGEIVSRFNDASKLRNAISNATLTLMIDSIMVIIGGIILYFQSPFLFVISLCIELIYTVIVLLFKKHIKKSNKIVMEKNAELTSHLVESLRGIKTIKTNNAEYLFNNKTETKFNKLLDSIMQAGKIENMQNTFTGFISISSSVIILWAGAYCIINGNMTIGQLLSFNALLIYFIEPLQNLINLQSMIQSSIVAAERIVEILEIETEKTSMHNEIAADLKCDIKLKDVSFRYGTRKLVLKNLNMIVGAGEKVAIVGESGTGKTTIANLLLHFYHCENGNIIFGNRNINDIDIYELRKRISYISPDCFIFSGTIIDNLTLGIDEYNIEDVIFVTKSVGIHDYIKNLPLGYNSILQESGANLSNGQRQKISIARAILKKPDIIIMDEATSYLDSISENIIENALEQLTENITTIIITHQLNTIQHCNKIFVLKDGRFVENGTHKELMELKGYYYCLWGKNMCGSHNKSID